MPRRKNEEDTRVDRRLGSLVRKRRRTAKLSQSKLADAIGVSYQQLQKYEAGVNSISIPTLIKLARVLGCNATDFLADMGAPDQ